jgi:hypothetical protein
MVSERRLQLMVATRIEGKEGEIFQSCSIVTKELAGCACAKPSNERA